MDYKIINLPSFSFIGLPIRTTNENDRAMQDIGMLWQKFMSENFLANIPDKTDDEILGMYTDYEGDFTKPYTFLIGCRVGNTANVPDGMTAITITPAKYSMFTGKGKLPEIVPQTWMKIWNSDIERAYKPDFEVYGIKANNREDAEIEIYISIK